MIILGYLVAFALSYICMAYRRHLLEIEIDTMSPPVDLLTSLLVPLIGIVYGLVSVLLFKLGILEKGVQA